MNKIDTSPAALRALADDTRLTLEDYLERSAQALRAVADEKEGGATWAFASWEDYLNAAEYLAFQAGRMATEKEASPWRSIETAPKDGTRVDLWCGDERVPDAYWCKGLWYTLQDYCGSLEGVPLIYSCTHWTPRPKGPKT